MDTGRLSCGSGGKGKGGKTKDDDIAEEEDESKDTSTQAMIRVSMFSSFQPQKKQEQHLYLKGAFVSRL